jgi:lysophospholipase L1-like esterase
MRRVVSVITVVSCLTLASSADPVTSGGGPAAGGSTAPKNCKSRLSDRSAWPGWLRPRRATVLVDSVLLGGVRALRSKRRCWRVAIIGRPALMVRLAEQELRQRGRRVARLVIVGLGYNSLWERGRRRYGMWARRFDREARRLLRTLRALGARQVVWVTLREPTPQTVPPQARGELGQYSWYFPYVNERLRRLDRRRDDLVLADWARASARPGLTYDSIHLNTTGASLMARTIWESVSRAARRQGSTA